MSAALAAVVPPWPKALGVALVIVVLGALPAPVVATTGAVEPCPNEPYRQASDSTQLPECRAYELVSPADAGAPVAADSLFQAAKGVAKNPGIVFSGNLFSPLGAALEVQADGSAVFWNSVATPPGTGAIERGGGDNPFRSVRTAGGWTTEDLAPTVLYHNGGPPLETVLLGASTDGSTVLVATEVPLAEAGAFADPQEVELDGWSSGALIYRVSAVGGAPQLVTHGEYLLPESGSLGSQYPQLAQPFAAASATPDLSEVAFRSQIPLEPEDTCDEPNRGDFEKATTYLWNANSVAHMAHVIAKFNGAPCIAPNVLDVPTILPNGRPILTPNPSGEPTGQLPPAIPDTGPLVENSSSVSREPKALTHLAGASGGVLLSTTPDGLTAYVLTEGEIYAVSTTAGWEGAGTPCVSCASDQVDVTYDRTSADGTHVLFTTAGAEPGLWEWDAAAGARLLTAATDIGPEDVVLSENGQYVVAFTTQLGSNPHGTSDLYELSVNSPPQLITSGESADTYTLATPPELTAPATTVGGVSDDGQRVVYNRAPASGAPEVIDEWVAGQTAQLSPQGSRYGYRVQELAGGELENVFFLADDPLVPWDLNAGQPDVYDAHTDGGFPFCTPGNPRPPPGTPSCVAPTETPNPTTPTNPPYTSNLVTPGLQLPSLPADTSTPVGVPTSKSLARRQRLAKALKSCKRHKQKKTRLACEKSASQKYSPTFETKKSPNKAKKLTSVQGGK